MKKTVIQLFVIMLLFSCNRMEQTGVKESDAIKQENNKIKVLNFGTFHFGYTPDANKTEFDEESKKAQKEVREIAKMIAEFKPTIICVEILPKYDAKFNKAYQEFLKDPSVLITNYGESSMVGFEVGRLSKVKRIYGIDNRMEYNYAIGNIIEEDPERINSIDPTTYLAYMKEPFKAYPKLAEAKKNLDDLSLLEKLRFLNQPEVLDFSININADNLLYVGTKGNFEGADEAAKFYHRNMKIYSNLNRIPMNKNDRIFILMGSAHAAFLREFIKRSPKFEMVNTLDYLKE